ncbi:hypothetical protein GIY56_11330 [Paracoccus sp. YIM 132242]|uniref:Uncharacterized protein n=1 Tax=Paracoccus lichenicola TaxID=2665644 RepID=A0A6L6HS73_9RHOB|nr:hypothetical protein [Paracoccus lichenicola]MTE00885.1 hypothetical protein [Paracoccus lichenicola]
MNMRLAWLLFLLGVCALAVFIVMGGGGFFRELGSNQKALSGTILGIALGAIVANINAYFTARDSREAVKITTLGLQIDLALEMGVIHVFLHHLIQDDDLKENFRSGLTQTINSAISKTEEIAKMLGDKNPQRNLAAQRLKMGLEAFKHQLTKDTLEELKASFDNLTSLLAKLDKA